VTQALLLAAAITFLAPQPNAQLVGPQLLEVTTTVANVDRVEFYVDGTLAGVARRPPWRVAHDFGTSLDAHTVTAKVWSNGYRNVDEASVTGAALSAAETVNVDLVEVPLRIRAPWTVTAADLRVQENGVEQTIRDLQPQRGAARFVFVIDRSLSMGDGKLAAALRAIDDESHLLRPDDRIEVVLFNHNVMKPRAVARGEKIAEVFGDIPPSGGTSLRDALSSIVTRDRTYAIVITDGGDRNSETSEEEALRSISGTKIVVDAIVLGGRSRFLERAAKNTGGSVVTAGRATVARALHDLIVDINSRYLLAYQSHGTDRGWRTISITARRGVDVVNARKGYFAR
jgi:Mg-chelatase subunit ChlD